MSQSHTPEPWTAERRNWRGEPEPHRYYVSGAAYEDPNGDGDGPVTVATAVAIVVGNATSRETTAANARRLVACVNACRGLPTEALEAGAVDGLRDAIAVLFEFWDHGTPVHPGAEVVVDLRAVVALVDPSTPSALEG